MSRTLVECKGDCRAYDCHAGPGTTEPGCGACITCLHRVLQGVEAERDKAKEHVTALLDQWHEAEQDFRSELRELEDRAAEAELELERKYHSQAEKLERELFAMQEGAGVLRQERDAAQAKLAQLSQRVEQLERERQETAALVAALEARNKVMAGRRRRRLPFSRFATQVVCEEPDCTRFADPPQGGGRALCDDHRRAAAQPLAAAQCREEA